MVLNPMVVQQVPVNKIQVVKVSSRREGWKWEGGFGGGGGGGGRGGNSQKNWGSGGGGGSYNVGEDQQNECCYNSVGHGKVIITLL